tara:strand:- start:574 stop:1452 length:879 start_codon:yes stop_codon:yes gene_type:complete
MITSGAYKQLPASLRKAVDKQLIRAEKLYGSKGKLPKYKVAELTGMERDAIKMAKTGVGSYAPYVNNASSGLAKGVETLGQSTGRFEGQGYNNFMDPYEQAVIEAGQRDIQEQGARSLNAERGRGLSAAAFGRSGRAALEQERVAADTSQQAVDFGARMRSEGFGQAMDRAGNAYGQQMDRLYQAGIGQAGVGMDYATLGGDVQDMGQSDVNFLSAIGGGVRDYNQSGLDADRATTYQNYMQPYQKLGFMGDIIGGVPSGSSSFASQPAPNPYTQTGGLMGSFGAGMNYYNS